MHLKKILLLIFFCMSASCLIVIASSFINRNSRSIHFPKPVMPAPQVLSRDCLLHDGDINQTQTLLSKYEHTFKTQFNSQSIQKIEHQSYDFIKIAGALKTQYAQWEDYLKKIKTTEYNFLSCNEEQLKASENYKIALVKYEHAYKDHQYQTEDQGKVRAESRNLDQDLINLKEKHRMEKKHLDDQLSQLDSVSPENISHSIELLQGKCQSGVKKLEAIIKDLEEVLLKKATALTDLQALYQEQSKSARLLTDYEKIEKFLDWLMSKECDCQYLREVCHIEEGSEIRIEDVFTCLSQVNQDRIDNLNKINENQYEYDRVKAVKEQTLLFKEEVDKLFQVFKSRQNEESEKITTVNELKEKIRHLQMTQESYSKKITSLEDYRMKLITQEEILISKKNQLIRENESCERSLSERQKELSRTQNREEEKKRLNEQRSTLVSIYEKKKMALEELIKSKNGELQTLNEKVTNLESDLVKYERATTDLSHEKEIKISECIIFYQQLKSCVDHHGKSKIYQDNIEKLLQMKKKLESTLNTVLPDFGFNEILVGSTEKSRREMHYEDL